MEPTCTIHDPDDVVPGRVCGRPLPCRDHSRHPASQEVFLERLKRGGERAVPLLPDSPWADRALTMRAARRLADRLEALAEEGGGANTALERERLDKVFGRLLASLDSLVRGCP